MIGVLQQLRKACDAALGAVVIVTMALLTLDVLWGVFSRYVLGAQTRWTDELATALMIWVAMLGAAVVYGERGHLGVDYFVGKLDPSARKLADAVVQVFVLLFAAAVMSYGGWVLVTRTLAAGQILPALGWPKGYVYLAVPISGAFLVFYAAVHLGELWAGGPATTSTPARES